MVWKLALPLDWDEADDEQATWEPGLAWSGLPEMAHLPIHYKLLPEATTDHPFPWHSSLYQSLLSFQTSALHQTEKTPFHSLCLVAFWKWVGSRH